MEDTNVIEVKAEAPPEVAKAVPEDLNEKILEKILTVLPENYEVDDDLYIFEVIKVKKFFGLWNSKVNVNVASVDGSELILYTDNGELSQSTKDRLIHAIESVTGQKVTVTIDEGDEEEEDAEEEDSQEDASEEETSEEETEEEEEKL